MRGLPPAVASGGHSSPRCAGLSPLRPLPLRSTGSNRAGSAIVAHGPSCSAAWGSSQTRARTRVPCTGRQILNHCATREAPENGFLNPKALALFLRATRNSTSASNRNNNNYHLLNQELHAINCSKCFSHTSPLATENVVPEPEEILDRTETS